jgi:hypothetical protein
VACRVQPGAQADPQRRARFARFAITVRAVAVRLAGTLERNRMSEEIAEYGLVGQEHDGPEFPVQVVLCKPVLSVRMSPAWFCLVTVTPLLNRPTEIYGEGSFQTLCLAARFAVQTLDTFLAQGGVLKYEDGEPFEANVFGFSLLPRGG